MSPAAMLSTCSTSSRCLAPFRAGPLRLANVRPTRASVSARANATEQLVASDSSKQSSLAKSSSLRVDGAAVAALLASGVLAGSCFAADSPESAAQAVQSAKLAADVLRPVFNIFTILYIVRVPMTWYPEIDGTKFPWAIAYAPTEPILSVTRKVIPLLSGVDVSPIVWVGLISFFSEILLGPQGLLTLIVARGGQ